MACCIAPNASHAESECIQPLCWTHRGAISFSVKAFKDPPRRATLSGTLTGVGMLRTVLGVMLGVVAWFAVVLGIGLVLKATDPTLNAALVAHATVTAMAERLAISFVATLVAGLVAALVGGERHRAALGAGLILLAIFGYYHVTMIWHQFPVWYHLTFFVSLPLLSLLGGRLRR